MLLKRQRPWWPPRWTRRNRAARPRSQKRCARRGWSSPDRAWQDVLDLASYSGWRTQEILGLAWEEIDVPRVAPVAGIGTGVRPSAGWAYRIGQADLRDVREADGLFAVRVDARALEDVGGADSPDLAPHRQRAGPTAGTSRPHQPARLPPRRHPRPALAHGVAHRLSGGRGADPLPPRLPPHRRPQPDPRQRRRAGRHALDRPQEPRHSMQAPTGA